MFSMSRSTCNFEINPITHFDRLCKLEKRGDEIKKKIFSSETTGPIATKLLWNDPWMALFQICVRWSRFPTKMAAKLKIEKRGDEIKKNLLLWNYWANLNQALLKWSLGGPLSKLCPSVPSCIQNGHITKNINFFKWPKLLYFKPESAQIWTV